VLKSILRKISDKFSISTAIGKIISGEMKVDRVISSDAFEKALRAFETMDETNESIILKEGLMEFVKSVPGVALAFALIAGLAFLAGTYPKSVGELEVALAKVIKTSSEELGDAAIDAASNLPSQKDIIKAPELIDAATGKGLDILDDLSRHLDKIQGVSNAEASE
jgi:hypothetical protein